MRGRVAFIDDEAPMRQAAEQWLGLAGLDVKCFDSGDQALAGLADFAPHAVISDVKMPGVDGLRLLEELQRKDPQLPVILITGHGDVPMAVQAMQAGAYSFLEKPYSPEHLLRIVERAIERRNLMEEIKRLRARLEGGNSIETRIIGNSPAINRLRDAILELAGTDANVVIHGETGTGKELAAKCLHEFGLRRERNFVAINCGAVPENIFESELFGHEKGAFTDAQAQRKGKLEHADGGTLLLDEIESMPLHLQVKLLRVIQERAVERLGSNVLIPLDVRFVTASKVDLLKAAKEKHFREDLYYRLNVASLVIPPLRERMSDVPLLFDYFASQAAERYRKKGRPLSAGDLSELMAHSWPGNVRELRNVADRYVLGLDATGRSIAEILRAGTGFPAAVAGSTRLPDLMAMHEKRIIEAALQACGGCVSETTHMLGIPRRTLYEKMTKYDIDKSRFADAATE